MSHITFLIYFIVHIKVSYSVSLKKLLLKHLVCGPDVSFMQVTIKHMSVMAVLLLHGHN